MRAIAIIILIGLGMCVHAQTNDPLITDRPSQTDASIALARGVLQIESGFTFDNSTLENNQTIDLYSWGTSWRVGVLDGLELRVFTQPIILQSRGSKEETFTRSGMADLLLGFKWGILNQNGEGPTSIALVSHIITPTGSEGLSTEEVGVLAKVAVSHQLGTRHSLSYNLGYEHTGVVNGEALYSLIWAIGLLENLSVFLETYGRIESKETWIASSDAGLAYLINPNLQLDYFFGTGINHNMNFHSLGISLRFGTK